MVQLEKYLTVGEILAHLAPGCLVVAIAAVVLGINPAVLTSVLGVFLFLLVSYLVGVLLDVLHRALVSRSRFRQTPNHEKLHESMRARGKALRDWLEEKLGNDPSLPVAAMVAHLRRENEEVANHVSQQLEIGNLVVNAGVSLMLVGLIGLLGMPQLRESAWRTTDEAAIVWSGRAQKAGISRLVFRRIGDYPRSDPCQGAAWAAVRMVWGPPRAGGRQERALGPIRFAITVPPRTGPVPSFAPDEEKSFTLSAAYLKELDGLEPMKRVDKFQKGFAELSHCLYCEAAGKLTPGDKKNSRFPSKEKSKRHGPGELHEHGVWHRLMMPPGEETYYVFTGGRGTLGARAAEPALVRDPEDGNRSLAKVPMASFGGTCKARQLARPYAISQLRVPEAESISAGNLTPNEEKVLARAEDRIAAGEYLIPGLVFSFFLGMGCYIIGRDRVAWYLSNLLHQGVTHGMGPAPEGPSSPDAQGLTSVDS